MNSILAEKLDNRFDENLELLSKVQNSINIVKGIINRLPEGMIVKDIIEDGNKTKVRYVISKLYNFSKENILTEKLVNDILKNYYELIRTKRRIKESNFILHALSDNLVSMDDIKTKKKKI